MQPAYGWIKKGERKEIPANSGRSRINLSGMIDIITQQLLWKWMKERVVYNTYYQYFENSKSSVFGFFDLLSNTDPESELGTVFRSPSPRQIQSYRRTGLCIKKREFCKDGMIEG